MVWKFDLFVSSGEGIEDTYHVEPVRGNLSHWTLDILISEVSYSCSYTDINVE
jgi:hypothetical protein